MKQKTRMRTRLANYALGLVVTFFLSILWVSAQSHHPEADAAAQTRGQVDTAAVLHDAAGEHGATAGHGDGPMKPAEEMLEILNHKVMNTPFIHEYPFPEIHFPQDWIIHVAGYSINLSLTRHTVYLLFAALVTALLLILAARQNASNAIPRGFGNLIEMVVVFVRDEVVQPFLGHDTKRFLPLLLTFFFFISIINLIGLLPFGATATGNINITAAFALTTFSFMILSGMKSNGIFGFWKGIVPPGLPGPLYLLMFPIEILGLLTKPFALAVRLFANMLSGGLVIGAFYALIFGMDTLIIAPVSLAFLIFMSLLKIFVCLLQAYIFTMLSSFFIGMSVHQSH